MVEWRNGHNNLLNANICLFSLPGVGNIGKAAIDALNSTNESIELARLHHTALPPLATLDQDGLLSPPHLSVKAIEYNESEYVLTITGTSQPLEPNNQGYMAREILELLKQNNVSELIVLAGMVDEAARKEIFIVPSSSSYRVDLESRGANVRRDEPSSGAIGMAALLSSLGPVYDINSACAIATTIGSSGDIIASQNLLKSIDKWFGLKLLIPNDANEKLIEKLKQ
ncbi:MAG: PAC2 family protein, partial [Candidatus Thermoplasmatota archaeon]|nr:PAC2 family protein [Candidatus Thermoplasmatota archaeon]